ncbi:hypothetical protein RFI_23681, partial [Reticulomyxa filosa]
LWEIFGMSTGKEHAAHKTEKLETTCPPQSQVPLVDATMDEKDKHRDKGGIVDSNSPLVDQTELMEYVDLTFSNVTPNIPELDDLSFAEIRRDIIYTNVLRYFERMYFLKDVTYIIHNARRSKDVQISPWSLVSSSSASLPKTFVRHLTYITPVKDPPPFMPAETNVEERQRFRFYGIDLLIIDVQLQTPSIKFGDCFFIHQKYTVRTHGNNGANECELISYLALNWVKSTWFKTVITSKATQESVEGVDQWIGEVKKIFPDKEPLLSEGYISSINANANAMIAQRTVSNSTLEFMHKSPTKCEQLWEYVCKPKVQYCIAHYRHAVLFSYLLVHFSSVRCWCDKLMLDYNETKRNQTKLNPNETPVTLCSILLGDACALTVTRTWNNCTAHFDAWCLLFVFALFFIVLASLSFSLFQRQVHNAILQQNFLLKQQNQENCSNVATLKTLFRLFVWLISFVLFYYLDFSCCFFPFFGTSFFLLFSFLLSLSTLLKTAKNTSCVGLHLPFFFPFLPLQYAHCKIFKSTEHWKFCNVFFFGEYVFLKKEANQFSFNWFPPQLICFWSKKKESKLAIVKDLNWNFKPDKFFLQFLSTTKIFFPQGLKKKNIFPFTEICIVSKEKEKTDGFKSCRSNSSILHRELS